MSALHLGCTGLIDNVDKLVAFSGAFCHLENPTYHNLNLDIFLLHGKEDDVIKFSYSDDALMKFKKFRIFSSKGYTI